MVAQTEGHRRQHFRSDGVSRLILRQSDRYATLRGETHKKVKVANNKPCSGRSEQVGWMGFHPFAHPLGICNPREFSSRVQKHHDQLSPGNFGLHDQATPRLGDNRFFAARFPILDGEPGGWCCGTAPRGCQKPPHSWEKPKDPGITGRS